MRVLNVIHYPVFGGPHNQALRLAAPLLREGWETIVLLPDEPGNAQRRLLDAGVPVETLPLHRLRASFNPGPHLGLALDFAPEVRAIRRLIRERRADVVQLSGLVNPHAAIAARMEDVPVVWQLLDTRAPKPVALMSMAFVRLLADAVMSTGLSVALAHPGGSGLRERLFPYYPPVDTELFRPRPEDREEVRLAWGVPRESPVIGCVANLNPQKGVVDLVRALALVRRQVADAHLVLIGAEHRAHVAYAAEIRAEMTSHGLLAGREVVFAGGRSDVERQLAGFDIFAFAPMPRGEGISTVVLEAMASELPVVATAVGGLPEAIDDPVDGRLVRPNDPTAMAHVIVELLRDPESTRQMARRARAAAAEKFSIGTCVDAHVAAYEFAVQRRGEVTKQRTPLRGA